MTFCLTGPYIRCPPPKKSPARSAQNCRKADIDVPQPEYQTRGRLVPACSQNAIRAVPTSHPIAAKQARERAGRVIVDMPKGLIPTAIPLTPMPRPRNDGSGLFSSADKAKGGVPGPSPHAETGLRICADMANGALPVSAPH